MEEIERGKKYHFSKDIKALREEYQMGKWTEILGEENKINCLCFDIF